MDRKQHSFTGLLTSHRRVISDHFSNNSNLFSDESSHLQVRSERRLSSGSTKPAAKGIILDDMLSSNEGGQHDYDWLLTPPETTLIPSLNAKEYQPKSVSQKRNPSVRSASTNRTSRLSVSQSESHHSSRPTRSSSVTRPSISTNRNSNFLNTSSNSVSSYIRPSTQTNRPPSVSRPSTASSRPTPSKSRPSTTTIDRIIRPSTPTSRSPTHSFNNRNVGPASRPSSPVSRARAWAQPISLPDFPNEAPPNLRTCLPERPVSAGRCRPGAAMTVKGNVDNINTRRHPSPVAARGRLAEPPGRGRLHVNGHAVESVTRKPVKVMSSENGTGFGRNISKKSLDMAIKHMDVRKGGARPLPGSTLFPHSIRSSQPSSASNNVTSKNGTLKNGYLDNKVKSITVEHNSLYSSKLGRADVYESLRYDSMLLKEDLKNTSWLHGADEKSDQSLLFDNGFESLPEPFAP